MIEIYKLKGFSTFIELLKRDKVEIALTSRISKNGIDKYRYRNKNIVFKIKKDYINLLFDKVRIKSYKDK